MPRSFQGTSVIEMSDFHLMTLTDMRKSFEKIKPRIIKGATKFPCGYYFI